MCTAYTKYIKYEGAAAYAAESVMIQYYGRYNGVTVKKKHRFRRLLLPFLALILLGGGLYILLLTLTPEIQPPSRQKSWTAPVAHNPEVELTENRLYIPKLKLNITYKDGDATVLRENAWHRFPDRGDPEQGGNFILAAHRFEIGLTPGQTKHKSPFYHIDALTQGDKIYVDFNGIRYEYQVTGRFKVKPDQTEIERRTDDPIMTLYSCTFQGQADGREVVIAKQTASDVDPALKF